ncbi:hypothetical protein FSST1_005147 [Fusarium sambucinum]
MLFPFVWTIVGLFVHVSMAEESGTTTTAAAASTDSVDILNIWDLDKSCDEEAQSMKDAMEDSLGMVTAAHEALKLLRTGLPNPRKDPEGYKRSKTRHTTVYKTCQKFFEMMKTKMLATNDFEHGYVGRFKRNGIKPKLMCGDEKGAGTWTWKPMIDLQEHHEFQKHMFKAGAWVYDYRYFFEETKSSGPLICTEEKHAQAFLPRDLIVFCDRVFDSEYKLGKWPRKLKETGISETQSLNSHRNTLPVTMLHELTHWFGGWAEIKDPSERARPDILDQCALTKYGDTIWSIDGVEQALDGSIDWGDAERNGWERVAAYGLQNVMNLAQCQGKRNQNHCGPEFAIKNADSLTFFALAMYLDEWNWSHGGEARFPNKNYNKREKPHT